MEHMELNVFLKHVRGVALGSSEDLKVLKTTGYLEENQGSMGGFTVPAPGSERIMQVALERSVVRSLVPANLIIPMTSDSITFSRIVDSTHASTILGGVLASWTDEAGSLSETNPAFGELTLNTRNKKLSGLVYTSNEWLDDSMVGAEALVASAFGQAIAYYSDDAFISGNGVAKPIGILSSSAILSQAIENGQTIADAILWQNIVKMNARMLPESKDRAVWLCNSDVESDLYEMDIPNGLVSSGPDGVYILGHKVVPTEKCATKGSVGDLILADFGNYIIGERALQVVASTEEPTQYLKDNTAWRFILRTDAQPIPAGPITPKNGTTTQSPFVTLAVRS